MKIDMGGEKKNLTSPLDKPLGCGRLIVTGEHHNGYSDMAYFLNTTNTNPQSLFGCMTMSISDVLQGIRDWGFRLYIPGGVA